MTATLSLLPVLPAVPAAGAGAGSGVLGLPVSMATVSAFALVLARTSAWAMTAPIFARNTAGVARLAIAIALAGLVTPLVPTSTVPGELGAYIMSAAAQVLFGLALGFLQGLLLTAVESAGSLADLTGGLSYGAQIDPITGSQSSAFTRLATLSAMALLFATDGAAHIVEGFVRTFQAMPFNHSPHLVPSGAGQLGHLFSQMIASALEIAAPLLGVVFITDVGIALLARFVPAANINSVGLSIKALVALAAFGTVLMLLPNVIDNLISPADSVVRSVVN